jgi:membrane protease YdiL (CAAX protease family)
MSTVGRNAARAQERNRQLLEGILGFVAFGGVSLLGRLTPYGIHLMAITGLLIPLAWGKLTGRWAEMGFTRRNWRVALLWGTGAGIATSLIGVLTVGRYTVAPSLGLQLAVGIPMSLLLASPFQEFFFRGWLQSRFEGALGPWGGLLAANVCFTLWHYLAPMAGTGGSSFPLNTLHGLASTFAAGLIYGYSFQRTRNILAPWLAHALALITFLAIGAMVLVESL